MGFPGWSPPDVPLETLPFFTSQYYSQFIDFDLDEEDLEVIRWEALDLPRIEVGKTTVDDVALHHYAFLLAGRDDEKARNAALLISKKTARTLMLSLLDHPTPRDVY